MSDVNVLVVFYSQYGAAERLGLAAGVGALQGRANIRLRRLADPSDESESHADPRRKQQREKMLRDYVVPRPADPLWADVVIFAAASQSRGEVEEYIASLKTDGAMAGKIAAPLSAVRDDVRLASMYAAAASAGFTVVPATTDSGDASADATAYGRRVTNIARTLKNNGE